MRVSLDNTDALLLSLLSSCAFAIRFWRLFHPNTVVFDEVYFGNFSNYYILSQFYFDIHPPLAKIVAFVFANLSEYDAGIDFEHCPPDGYPAGDYVMLRITPALFSALCGPLVYLSVRFAHFSQTAALAAAVLTVFDTSLGTEGRHILSDGILHFFSVLHVAVLMHTLAVGSRDPSFPVWHLVNAVSLGAACSCKNTAWGLMAMDGFGYMISFLPLLKIGVIDYVFDVALWGISLAVLEFLVYVIVFEVHFILLPYAGPGVDYLKEDLKRQLIPNSGVSGALWGRRVQRPGLISRVLWLAMDMHQGNMGITEFHDSMSMPSEWPLLRGIMTFFWMGNNAEIRCIGNVFSHYFALIGVVSLVFSGKHPQFRNAILFALGWAVCYFPFFLIPRVMYQYHYCIPLMIGTMAFGAGMDVFVPKKVKEAVTVVVVVLAVFGFWLWSPLVYGTPMHDRAATLWTRLWTEGGPAHAKRRNEYYASKRNE